jgi:hypothetical protein
MALDLSNKAITMMIKAVVGSLGIDGEALITNIQGFQSFVLQCIGKHDERLVAIENAVLENTQVLREQNALLAKINSHFVEASNGLESEYSLGGTIVGKFPIGSHATIRIADESKFLGCDGIGDNQN